MARKDFNTDSSTEIIIRIQCGKKQNNGKNCVNDENYKKKFFGKFFNMYFINNLVNLDNITHPFLNVLDKDYMFINPLLGKFIDILYYNLQLQNDFGYIFENMNIEKNIKVDSIQHNYILNNYPEEYSINDINMITVKIMFSDRAEKYRRIYAKLQNVFAEVAGIFKVIMIAGSIIVERYSKRMYHTEMINEYFYNYTENEELKDYFSYIGLQNNFKNNQSLLEKSEDKEKNNRNLDKSKSIIDNSINFGNFSISKNFENNKSNELEDKKFVENEMQYIDKIEKHKYYTNYRRENLNEENLNLNLSSNRILKVTKNDIGFINKLNISNYDINQYTTKFEQINKATSFENTFKNILNSRLKSSILKKRNYQLKNIQKNINLSNNYDKKINYINSVDFTDSRNKQKLEDLLNSNLKNVNREISKFSYLTCFFNLLPKKYLDSKYLEKEKLYKKLFKKLKKVFELSKVLSAQKNVDLIKKIILDDEQRKALDYAKFQFTHCQDILFKNEDAEKVKNYFLSKNKFSNLDEIILRLILSNEK